MRLRSSLLFPLLAWLIALFHSLTVMSVVPKAVGGGGKSKSKAGKLKSGKPRAMEDEEEAEGEDEEEAEGEDEEEAEGEDEEEAEGEDEEAEGEDEEAEGDDDEEAEGDDDEEAEGDDDEPQASWFQRVRANARAILGLSDSKPKQKPAANASAKQLLAENANLKKRLAAAKAKSNKQEAFARQILADLDKAKADHRTAGQQAARIARGASVHPDRLPKSKPGAAASKKSSGKPFSEMTSLELIAAGRKQQQEALANASN